MSLPSDLKDTLDRLLTDVPAERLNKASQDLTARYRSKERNQINDFMSSDSHRYAYLAVRMPATFAAVWRVLNNMLINSPSMSPKSVCDIGAGPGTASWVVSELFHTVTSFTLLEKDPFWLKVGKSLMAESARPTLQAAKWIGADLVQQGDIAPHDLVILSYVVGELPIDQVIPLAERAWGATEQALVVIEPGTPHGFERIRLIREELIKKGAYVMAPCPHQRSCPMGQGDWCHFVQRVERSYFHRKAKDVTMGYEDEKFSYIVLSKTQTTLPHSRILRHPQHHSGHIDFIVCGQKGIEKSTLSKKMGERYKRARKLEWGDILDHEEVN